MDALMQVPLTMTTMKVAAVAGTTTTVTTTGTTLFCIRGKAYSKAALTNQAFPATDDTTGVAFVSMAKDKGQVLVLGFNSAGTLIAAQGPAEALDTSGNFIKAPSFPALKETFCPFAYVVCKNGSTGSAWTPGTSNWTATGMTATFVDVMTMTDRPQVS